jgi:hypothetical protein
MSKDDEENDKSVDLVRAALEAPQMHVRVKDQDVDADALEALLESVPKLVPFGSNHCTRVRAIVDWDHQLPSQHLVLRIYASYSEHEAETMETQVRSREQQIESGDVYPEFDVPDFAEIEASEAYAGVFRPGSDTFEDFRFFAPWRKEVRQSVARSAVGAVKKLDSFKRAFRERKNDALGSAVVVGWAPPCLAHGDNWAIEVWLLTEFDGQAGKAMVFMVDSETDDVTREYETDVHLA